MNVLVAVAILCVLAAILVSQAEIATYLLKGFLITKFIPLSVVFDPDLDHSSIEGWQVIDCLHGGNNCPSGVTYYEDPDPVETETTTIIPTQPAETIPEQTVSNTGKKTAYISGQLLYSVLYSDGTFKDNILTATKHSIKLIQNSVTGTQDKQKTVVSLMYQPILDQSFNKDLNLNYAKLIYDLSVTNGNFSKLMDRKTIDYSLSDSNTLKFSTVIVSYDKIVDTVRLLEGNNTRFSVVMKVTGYLKGTVDGIDVKGNIPTMNTVSSFSFLNSEDTILSQDISGAETIRNSNIGDSILCSQTCKDLEIAKNTTLAFVLYVGIIAAIVAAVVILIWKR